MIDTSEYNFTPTDFVISDSTGAIILMGSVPAYQLQSLTVPDGGQILDVKGDPSGYYVLNQVLTKRPANTATLVGMKLENLPNPCVIMVEGVAHTCTDGTADLSFSQPGTYPVQVSAFPMLDAGFLVTQS